MLFHKYKNRLRWRLFANEYIKDFNLKEAYLRCGCYRVKDGHKAYLAAYRLFRKPIVQHYISEAIEARMERLKLEQDDAVLELFRLVNTDIRDYAEWDNNSVKVKPSVKLTDDEARAIQEVEVIEHYSIHEGKRKLSTRRVKVKPYDKIKALDMLFKHFGLYSKNNVIRVEDSREDQVNEVLKMLQDTRDRLEHSYTINGHTADAGNTER